MSVRLRIDDEKRLKKFYKRMPLYRSFLFRDVTFELVEDKYGVEDIVKALNIKNRKERITYIYDTVCNMIDSNYCNKNLCDFKNNQCRLHRKMRIDKKDGCCGFCKYKSCKGCLTKNFACKMFYCSLVKKRYELIKEEDIKILKVLNLRQQSLIKKSYFSSRNDVIMDLYIGSIVIGMTRIIYRIIRDRVFG